VYPNPQDVLPLPPRPDLAQYKKRAKELVTAVSGGAADAVAWAQDWIGALEKHTPESMRLKPRDRDRRARQLALFAVDRLGKAGKPLSQAQFVLARAHGFASWPRFSEHVREMALLESETATFEQAADAIADGDLATLKRLIAADPSLVRAQSHRDHHATLLIYTAANGVENYRQRTPANIVEITRYLLDQGADIRAEADVYGGGSKTLGLTVTSAHPRLRGTQIPQAELLLARGAEMEKGIVASCLANGCPEAAGYLASLGAECNFVDAAGIGRIDLLEKAYDEREKTPIQNPGGALVNAAWYGERATVGWLLDHGFPAGEKGAEDGQTALHVAAYQGDRELVHLLLGRGAPINLTDTRWGTTPLVWALHAWLEDNRGPVEKYKPILMELIGAGATVPPEMIDDERIRADPELHQVLLRAAGAR
jgi:hypothetical protein